MKTKEQMINLLIVDELQTIIQLAQDGDYSELEAWLGPIFREDFESCSEDEIKSRYIAKGLANSSEEEEDAN